MADHQDHVCHADEFQFYPIQEPTKRSKKKIVEENNKDKISKY